MFKSFVCFNWSPLVSTSGILSESDQGSQKWYKFQESNSQDSHDPPLLTCLIFVFIEIFAGTEIVSQEFNG